ncbi:MAG: hypothetical protein FMNOHCHN_03733 [Ignavibacteriaceae bacterium]|nr:hypothetical protein [Ignavibacteriaceae bacterium]
MKDDKNKMAGLIIAKMKEGKPEMESSPKRDGDETDDSQAYMAVADEIMMAIEQKDPKLLIESLKSFMEMCEDYDSEED